MRHAGNSRGFTLTEILITTGLVGVLAGVAVPVMLSQQNNSADTSAQGALTSVAAVIESSSLPRCGVVRRILVAGHVKVTGRAVRTARCAVVVLAGPRVPRCSPRL